MTAHQNKRGRDNQNQNTTTEYRFCPSCDIELLRDKNGYYCMKCNYYEDE